MDITVKFLESKANIVYENGRKIIDWRPVIQTTADEIAALIPAGKVNKSAEQIENMLGDVMTPPNEFGYATIRMTNINRIIVTEAFVEGLTGCQLVLGDTAEEKIVIGTNGEEIIETILGGKIAG